MQENNRILLYMPRKTKIKQAVKDTMEEVPNLQELHRTVIRDTAEIAVQTLEPKINIYTQREDFAKDALKACIYIIKLTFKSLGLALGGLKNASKYLIDHGTQILHLSLGICVASTVYYMAKFVNFVTDKLFSFADTMQEQAENINTMDEKQLQVIARNLDLDDDIKIDEEPSKSLVPHSAAPPVTQSSSLVALPSNIGKLATAETKKLLAESVQTFMTGSLSLGACLLITGAVFGYALKRQITKTEESERRLLRTAEELENDGQILDRSLYRRM
jgi:hypothetical protein